MRLRIDATLMAVLLLGVMLGNAVPTQAMQAGAPDAEQVDAALQVLRDDPALGVERKVNRLRWIADEEVAKGPPESWRKWLINLFSWVSQSLRILIWVLGVVLAALVLVYVLRLLRERRAGDAGASSLAPARVRDLDIRPESLPDDVGAAARQLWDAGESRPALALLYRGMLSRLAYVHGAPVRDSTTEGESIGLARGCLDAGGGEFAATLVGTWQLAVYGGQMPQTPAVHALCDGFGPALDPPPAAAQEPVPAGGAA